jgi:hypothetical protein
MFFFNTMCIVHFEARSSSVECIKRFHVCVGVHCPLSIIQCLLCLLLGLKVCCVHCDSFTCCESWKVGNQDLDDEPQALFVVRHINNLFLVIFFIMVYGLGIVIIKRAKSMSHDRQNSIKIIILLDIFLWCHFNVMLIIECTAKQLIWMLKNSK